MAQESPFRRRCRLMSYAFATAWFVSLPLLMAENLERYRDGLSMGSEGRLMLSLGVLLCYLCAPFWAYQAVLGLLVNPKLQRYRDELRAEGLRLLAKKGQAPAPSDA